MIDRKVIQQKGLEKIMADSHDDGQSTNIYLRVALLGFVTGLRSMAPLALLSWTRRVGADADETIAQVLGAPAGTVVTSLLAAGELVGDKLPITPSRISAAPLLGRIAIGAFAGMTLAQREKASPVMSAALGMAGASVGALTGYYGRQSLNKIKWVPGFVWAGLEDSLALGLGLLATKKNK